MKSLVAMALLLCAGPLLASGGGAADLHLQITMTRGERSKDSNSSTTTLTISGGKLVYKTTFGGRNSGRAVAPKEFALTSQDLKTIIKLIMDRKLLRTASIERERDVSGIYRYFELSINAVVDGSEGLINIKASRKATDLKDDELYKDSIALIDQIYKILHRFDEDVDYEPLIP
ncbi:MAG: hypothetical protein QOJ64_2889 [Acidobacteriota bacterium]|jgi:hypothetical protein|nr:hypothetical protein [Acidobacteriota bacterium]